MEFDRVDCFDKISVRVPRNWVASEDEEDGTYGFYDPDGGSGTLRISLFTNQRDRIYTPEMLQVEEFEYRNENGVKFFSVNDCVVAEWNKPAHKEADLHMFWWTISAVIAPKVTRRVLFSYAVPEQLFAMPAFPENLRTVRECVLATHFIAQITN